MNNQAKANMILTVAIEAVKEEAKINGFSLTDNEAKSFVAEGIHNACVVGENISSIAVSKAWAVMAYRDTIAAPIAKRAKSIELRRV